LFGTRFTHSQLLSLKAEGWVGYARREYQTGPEKPRVSKAMRAAKNRRKNRRRIAVSIPSQSAFDSPIWLVIPKLPRNGDMGSHDQVLSELFCPSRSQYLTRRALRMVQESLWAVRAAG
jgi:hypothetical protein